MKVHLVDGTYELFRCYFGAPPKKHKGREVGATRAMVRSLAAWLRAGEVTHIACAFDTVIESFRNELFPGYKTGEGIDPELYSQFELVERAVAALGITVWSMIDFEADDALATAAHKFTKNGSVTQVRLCSPDKDLAQCVIGKKVVGYDRGKNTVLDEDGVVAKFGVRPQSIPDWLALVGDTADGIPGIERWGMKSASLVLAAYGTLDKIPAKAKDWKVTVRGAESLAESLNASRKEAALYKKLATIRYDVPLKETLKEIEWKGANADALEKIAEEIADPELAKRIEKWAD